MGALDQLIIGLVVFVLVALPIANRFKELLKERRQLKNHIKDLEQITRNLHDLQGKIDILVFRPDSPTAKEIILQEAYIRQQQERALNASANRNYSNQKRYGFPYIPHPLLIIKR